MKKYPIKLLLLFAGLALGLFLGVAGTTLVFARPNLQGLVEYCGDAEIPEEPETLEEFVVPALFCVFSLDVYQIQSLEAISTFETDAFNSLDALMGEAGEQRLEIQSSLGSLTQIQVEERQLIDELTLAEGLEQQAQQKAELERAAILEDLATVQQALDSQQQQIQTLLSRSQGGSKVWLGSWIGLDLRAPDDDGGLFDRPELVIRTLLTDVSFVNVGSSSAHVVPYVFKSDGSAVPAMSQNVAVGQTSNFPFTTFLEEGNFNFHEGWFLLVSDQPIFPFGDIFYNNYKDRNIDFYPIDCSGDRTGVEFACRFAD